MSSLSIPAIAEENFSSDIPLVSFKEVLVEAIAKNPSFVTSLPAAVLLIIDLSESRQARAAAANIRGGIIGIPLPVKEGDAIRQGFFRVEVIKAARSAKGLVGRSADIDDIIGFIAQFPEDAKRYTIICFNSRYFGEGDVFSRVFGFRFRTDEKTKEGFFEVRKLERPERALYPGDLVLMLDN